MLNKIKILLGLADDDESRDEILSVLISLCKDEAVEFCNLDQYSSQLDAAVIGMVIERYNQIGTEGISKVMTNGITEEYMGEYSKPIKEKLIKNRKVRLVK